MQNRVILIYSGLLIILSLLNCFIIQAQSLYNFEVLTETYEEFDDGEKIDVYYYSVAPDIEVPHYDFSFPDNFCFYLINNWECNDISSQYDFALDLFQQYGLIVIGGTFVIHPSLAILVDRQRMVDGTEVSDISYKLEGNEGERILKLQWRNWGFLNEIIDDNVSEDFINFQFWLYEENGIMELHYGPSNITQPELDFGYGIETLGSPVGIIDKPACVVAGYLSDENGISDEYFSIIGGEPLNPTITNVCGDNCVYEDWLAWYKLMYYTDFDGEPVNSSEIDYINPLLLDEPISSGTVYRFSQFSWLTGLSSMPLKEIEVYPNPVEDNLQIIFPQEIEQVYSVKVFDSTGSVMLSFDNSSKLDLSTLKSGLYYIKAETNEMEYVSKIIKN